MSTHPECDGFQDDGTWIFSELFSPMMGGVIHLEYVVTIDLYGFYAVAYAFVNELLAAKLLVRRSAESIAVVFDEEDDGELPHSGHVEGLMEIAFGCAPIARKGNRDFLSALQFVRKGDPIGNPKHGAKVRNHPHDGIVVGTKVEASFPTFAKPRFFALPLSKELSKRDATGGENAQVSVQGHNVLVWV